MFVFVNLHVVFDLLICLHSFWWSNFFAIFGHVFYYFWLSVIQYSGLVSKRQTERANNFFANTVTLKLIIVKWWSDKESGKKKQFYMYSIFSVILKVNSKTHCNTIVDLSWWKDFSFKFFQYITFWSTGKPSLS
jgi:hypothetical protein